MNQIIRGKLADFNVDDYRPIVQRQLDIGEPLEPKVGNLVKVVTGMRRSGKSYRPVQEIDSLLARGTAPGRICYFNFEDDRLSPITPATGDEALETFFTLHPEALGEGAYLFFDELQEMDGWGPWLRRVVDTHKATIYVSGSSSKMLSREVSTEFRGRAIDFELLPYSFREFAHIAHPDIDLTPGTADRLPSRDRILLATSFERYLERGGFPAAIGLPHGQAITLLQSYAQRVVARDVVERHDLMRPRIASLFAQRLLSMNAKPYSIRKIEADLRSLGLKTSRETLGDLIGYFEDAYLLFPVREFTYSLSESTTSNPKVYAIDPGLALANARANSNELGQRLENAVYLELRRRLPTMRRDAISSLRTKQHGREVDFVVGDALSGDAFELYQVTASMREPATAERELRALWEALEETGLTVGTLIALEGEEREYERNGRRIRQVPAWKWFLE